MLKKFSVKNYKNFKDEISIDFSDVKDYQYNRDLITNGLINSAIIYGRNASGKSNFGLALFDITLHLVDKENIPDQKKHIINALSVEDFASFHYVFSFDHEDVEYYYKKNAQGVLIYEDLRIVGGDRIFTYNFQKGKIDKGSLHLVNAQDLNFQFKDKQISILRYISNNVNPNAGSVIEKVMHFVDSMLWFRSVQHNSYIGYSKGADSIVDSIIRNGLVQKFEKYLHDSGIDADLEVVGDAIGNKVLVQNFGQNKLPFWEIASSGTRALTLYFYWSVNFRKITFLFVDEFDAYYHFELARSIVKSVMKNKRLQSVFTTHNTSLLSNDIMRPDCYFVIGDGKLKSLPKLTERELREAHNLEKLYRQGEFIV